MASIPLNDIINSKVNQPQEVVRSKDFAKLTSSQPTMKVHIEIDRSNVNGSFSIKADIENQDDLAKFHSMYGDYMPRKKWLGLI